MKKKHATISNKKSGPQARRLGGQVRPKTIVIVGMFVFFLLSSFYAFFLKDTGTSYSVTQKWSEYYSLEDWNLAMHAYPDIDNDGKKDMVIFTNCVFLSSVNDTDIPVGKRCKEPEMSRIGFPGKKAKIGQEMIPKKPFTYNWLRKSYIVKTYKNEWKLYDLNGLQLRVYMLNKDNLFFEIKPSALDRIDVLAYQLAHVGVGMLLVVLP